MKCFVTVFLFVSCFFPATLSAQHVLYGRTTGPLSYLEYGTGEDRLGGAKMGYLDSGILLKIIDSTNRSYRVQLSALHFAYIPKVGIVADTIISAPQNYLTGSWRVWGDEQYDYVSVSLPERLPYRSIQQMHPSRIVVDIFGAVSNTNWITGLKTVKEIRNAWYEQVEDDVFRIIIELHHPQHWGHFIYYDRNTLHVRLKRQPSRFKKKKFLVAIDAGHGGSNSGARGAVTGIAEKDYTLRMAQLTGKYLRRKGFRVFMTRTTDEDLDMTGRMLMLRQQDPHLLVSIHLNSSRNTAVKGVSTYYRYIGFRSLSQCLLDRMLELDLNNFGNIGGFNFSLNGPTEYINCLLEVAFLSNAEDEQRILDEKFQKAVAKKVYKGLKDWMKYVKKLRQ